MSRQVFTLSLMAFSWHRKKCFVSLLSISNVCIMLHNKFRNNSALRLAFSWKEKIGKKVNWKIMEAFRFGFWCYALKSLVNVQREIIHGSFLKELPSWIVISIFHFASLPRKHIFLEQETFLLNFPNHLFKFSILRFLPIRW